VRYEECKGQSVARILILTVLNLQLTVTLCRIHKWLGNSRGCFGRTTVLSRFKLLLVGENEENHDGVDAQQYMCNL
jgi:hypothetical protein